MRVFLLTEGSSNIGFGHITRCTSLYDAFAEKQITPTFIINGDETIIPLLKNKKSIAFNWLIEKDKLFNLIKDADIAVIDSYLADTTFYNHISETVKIPVYIDDTMRIDYPAGVVLNGTIFAETLDYPKKKGVVYLLGCKYIPLRREFCEVPEKLIRQTIKTVLLTFGGDDIKNLTPKVLNILNQNFPHYTKKVVIGEGFKNIQYIESLKNENTELVYFPDAEGMKKVMLESDVAISAAGQTLYELARVGVSTIAVAVAENQMNNVMGFQKAGFIEYAGWWKDRILLNNIDSKLTSLIDCDRRKDKAKIGQETIDGLGAMRTVHTLLSI